MPSEKIIKILKSTGFILGLLSIVYTSIQIASHISQTKAKLKASFYYYDLTHLIPTREIFPNVINYEERVNSLNKHLKSSIPLIGYYELDTVNRRKIQDIRNVFLGQLSNSLFEKKSVFLTYVENISNSEISDIKINLNELSDFGTFSYAIKRVQNNRIAYEYDSLKTLTSNDKIINIGSLLPKEKKVLITYGLTQYFKNYPRVIYPDGYVDAYSSSTITHSSKFDERLTELVTSSVFIQILIGILSVLGLIHLVNISSKMGHFFAKKDKIKNV